MTAKMVWTSAAQKEVLDVPTVSEYGPDQYCEEGAETYIVVPDDPTLY